MTNKQTEYIVFGYARRIENVLPDNTNPFHHIPTSITQIIISYVNNYFDTRGIYTWKISNHELITKILTAKSGDKFESDEFMMSRLKWKLEIFPFGYDESLTGYFVIGLRLLKTPLIVDKVEFGRIFRVFECKAAAGWSSSISTGEISKWSKKLPTLEILKIDPISITIECEINIHRLILKENYKFNIAFPLQNFKDKIVMCDKYHLIYSLNKTDSIAFKNSKCEKTMCSDVLNDLWIVQVSPNGDGTEYVGYVSVFLILFQLPIGVKTIKTQFTIICDDINKKYTLKYDFDMEKFGWGDAYFCSLQELKKFHEISFVVDIQVLEVVYECKKENMKLQITNPLKITNILLTEL
eukprot:34512_1